MLSSLDDRKDFNSAVKSVVQDVSNTETLEALQKSLSQINNSEKSE
jgi:hypothetical protein